jgi:DNA polymerase
MGAETNILDRAAIDSLLEWWAEAGVDVAVGEQPRAWLRGDPAAAVAETVAIKVDKPADFASFRAWLDSAPGLPLDHAGAVRVAPRGMESAPVMLLSDLPDGDDASDRRPIGGDAFELVTKMLAAIGVDAEDAYHANLACFHAPGARIGRDELDACGAIARDHIRHAKPQRLILMGDAPSRALLSEPLARARGRIHKVEGVRTIATFHPRWLLQRPSDKALAWRDLLLLMSESDR